MTFQEIIDSIENLAIEDQDYLFELIQKRRIENRRSEIAATAKETLEAVKEGRAKKGTVDDLIMDLREEQRNQKNDKDCRFASAMAAKPRVPSSV